MDWVTTSSLATAGGTQVLAVATFASVPSANRAARAAERSLLAGLRPMLMPSRHDDPPQKVGFQDQKWLRVSGASAAAEATDDAVYLAMSLRNVGAGIAVLHGWRLIPELTRRGEQPDPEGFTRLTRDIFVPSDDIGFWQGTFRDPSRDDFKAAHAVVERREPMTVEILYGDLEGGQRMVTRFALYPREEDGYVVTAGRHWNIDMDGFR